MWGFASIGSLRACRSLGGHYDILYLPLVSVLCWLGLIYCGDCSLGRSGMIFFSPLDVLPWVLLGLAFFLGLGFAVLTMLYWVYSRVWFG